MAVLNPFKNLTQKAAANSVSWGTLVVFALGMGILVLILLSFYNGWLIQTAPYYLEL